MRNSVSAWAGWLVLTAAAGLLFAGGCASTDWRHPDGTIVTGRVDSQKEPTTGRVYHLYIPTTYNPRRAYPLVVTGHGMYPWDEANNQRNRWIDVAERYGLIICAPDCDSATGSWARRATGPLPNSCAMSRPLWPSSRNSSLATTSTARP